MEGEKKGFSGNPLGKKLCMARHILVVDDDAALLEMYQLVLEDEGYQVSLSNTTFENVADVEQLHPDLMVLDVKVRAQDDGLALLQQLRSYPPTSSLPVLLCTAARAKSVRERVEVLRLQGVPVVYKPFQIDELLRAIADALSDHEKTGGSKPSF